MCSSNWFCRLTVNHLVTGHFSSTLFKQLTLVDLLTCLRGQVHEGGRILEIRLLFAEGKAVSSWEEFVGTIFIGWK